VTKRNEVAKNFRSIERRRELRLLDAPAIVHDAIEGVARRLALLA
jgi:hypothetical protein